MPVFDHIYGLQLFPEVLTQGASMDYNRDAALEKAEQAGDALYALGSAAIAACLVWTVGEPAALQKMGSGVPWWVYLLLFARFFGAIARIMTDDTSLQGLDPVGNEPSTPDGNSMSEPDTHFAYRSPSF
jgi:hypothetical protein